MLIPPRWRHYALLLLAASAGCHPQARVAGETKSAVRRDEARFTSGGLSLAATITRPATEGRHPAVVVLHAAGLEERSDYRPFADSLASRGIVVLAYDMRGSGDSEGEAGPYSFQELERDARAALRLLRAQDDVDSEKVGLWALSRGGYTAPAVAIADADVRFLIVIGSPALPVAVSDSSAQVEVVRNAGAGEDDIARAERFVHLLLQAARNGAEDYARLRQAFDQAKDEAWLSHLRLASLPAENWLTRYGHQLTYDPDSLWSRVRIPTLILYGADDQPRLVRDSRSRILSALTASGASVDSRVFAGADHLLRVPQTSGERTFAGGFFDLQASWIAANTR